MSISLKQRDDFTKSLQNTSNALLDHLLKLDFHDKSTNNRKQQANGDSNDDIDKQEETAPEEASIFARIPEITLDEGIDSRIMNLKLTTWSNRRKDEFFKRFKQQQEAKFNSRRRQWDKNSYSQQIKANIQGKTQFKLQLNGKELSFPLSAQDMEKLKPDTDLNDTIIGNYLRIFQLIFLPERSSNLYILSSFLMEKIIGDFVKEEGIARVDPSELVPNTIKRVRENYKQVKRWAKNTDLFEKDFVVFPINAFSHWFCVIIANPKNLLLNTGKTEIIYCDSMLEKKDFIIEAVRQYLYHELKEKKNIEVSVNEGKVPCYQLLLPRQTNCHDCGLYMLAYIEQLLSRPSELENLTQVKNRRKLKLFPRTLTYTFRERLRKLLIHLTNAQKDDDKNQILVAYKGEKERILKEAEPSDFDTINEKEFKKYEKMNSISSSNNLSEEEKSFALEIKFYIDPDINYYEKDK